MTSSATAPAPAVKYLVLVQDGHEDRRPLDNHFGAWVIHTGLTGRCDCWRAGVAEGVNSMEAFDVRLHANRLRPGCRRPFEVRWHAAGRAGMGKRVHPHGLRHPHAVELERAGVPVSQISKLL